MGLHISPGLVPQFSSQSRRTSPWILWENKVTFTNVSSDTAEETHPITNVWNPQTFSYWVAASSVEQVVDVEALSGYTNSVCIARHNFGTIGATVSIEAITAESSPAHVVVHEGIAPGDDSPLWFFFERDIYTNIRIRIAPTEAIAPQMAVLMVGDAMILPNGIQPGYTPIGDSPDLELSVGQSQKGEYLGSFVLSSGLRGTTPIRDIIDSYYQNTMKPFLQYANAGGTFFFAWSPIVRPLQIAYCWFDGSAKSVIPRSKPTWDVDMPMRGLAL